LPEHAVTAAAALAPWQNSQNAVSRTVLWQICQNKISRQNKSFKPMPKLKVSCKKWQIRHELGNGITTLGAR